MAEKMAEISNPDTELALIHTKDGYYFKYETSDKAANIHIFRCPGCGLVIGLGSLNPSTQESQETAEKEPALAEAAPNPEPAPSPLSNKPKRRREKSPARPQE